MTPTDDDNLNARLAEAMGWRWYAATWADGRMLRWLDNSNDRQGMDGPGVREADGTEAVVADAYRYVPRFATDPAASARLRAWMWGKGWRCSIAHGWRQCRAMCTHDDVAEEFVERTDILNGDVTAAECRATAIACARALGVGEGR